MLLTCQCYYLVINVIDQVNYVICDKYITKSKIAKHNSLRPTKEACMMKIAYGDHFLRRITSMYKFDIFVKSIRENVTK